MLKNGGWSQSDQRNLKIEFQLKPSKLVSKDTNFRFTAFYCQPFHRKETFFMLVALYRLHKSLKVDLIQRICEFESFTYTYKVTEYSHYMLLHKHMKIFSCVFPEIYQKLSTLKIVKKWSTRWSFLPAASSWLLALTTTLLTSTPWSRDIRGLGHVRGVPVLSRISTGQRTVNIYRLTAGQQRDWSSKCLVRK